MKLAYALCGVAALSAAITFTLWASGDFHRGWSQTDIPVERVDEFTGIEYVEYEPGFRAGLDFVAVGSGVSLCFFAGAIWARYRAARRASLPQ